MSDMCTGKLLKYCTVHVHVLMRDEEEGRKKQARSKKQGKAKQHSTPKAVTFPKKNELPRVGLEPFYITSVAQW